MRRLVQSAAAMLLGSLLGAASSAWAHPMDVATAAVAVRERDVEIDLRVNLFELDLLLGLDRNRDGTVDPEEIEAARAQIVEYLRARVVVTSGATVLPLEVGPLHPETGADRRRVLAGVLRFSGREPLASPSIRCEPLADLGLGHRTIARVTRGSEVDPFVFEEGATYHTAPASSAQGGGAFLRLGILHIFTGWDHVLFLVGLLLLGGGVVQVLKIATSFTVAHTLTLSLAALGAVTLPPRLVEAGIAFSIAYVALENLLRRRLEWRWLVSFGFGLVHGFGFANVLAEMNLPRAGLASSLFLFNAGVEVGQVAIVLAVFPLLAMLRRTRAHRTVVTSASAAILATGLFWLWQRAL